MDVLSSENKAEGEGRYDVFEQYAPLAKRFCARS